MSQEQIPLEVTAALAGEQYDFFVKARRKEPLFASSKSMLGGLIFLSMSLIFFFSITFPVIQGKEVRFTVNDVPTVATKENWKPLVFPTILTAIFFVVGIGIAGGAVSKIIQEGPWFIGTPKRFIIREKNTTRSMSWEEFTGEIEVRGTELNGTLTLVLRSGEFTGGSRTVSRFVPNKIYITEIRDIFGIEKIIRQRIQENDPTPPQPSGPTYQGIV